MCFEFEEANNYVVSVSIDSNLRKVMHLLMVRCAGFPHLSLVNCSKLDSVHNNQKACLSEASSRFSLCLHWVASFYYMVILGGMRFRIIIWCGTAIGSYHCDRRYTLLQPTAYFAGQMYVAYLPYTGLSSP